MLPCWRLHIHVCKLLGCLFHSSTAGVMQVSCNTLTPECAPVADALTMVHQHKQLRPRDQEVAAQQTVLNITHMGKQRWWQLAAAVRPETLPQASAAV